MWGGVVISKLKGPALDSLLPMVRREQKYEDIALALKGSFGRSIQVQKRFIEAHKNAGMIPDPGTSCTAALKMMREHIEIMEHAGRYIKLSKEENVIQTIVSQDYVETLIDLLPMRVKLEKNLECVSANDNERKKQYEVVKGWIQFHQRFLSNQGININEDPDKHITMAIQDTRQRSNDNQGDNRKNYSQ